MLKPQTLPIITVDENRCNGCSRCMPACPAEAITISDVGLAVIETAKCTLCQACLDSCPKGALSLSSS